MNGVTARSSHNTSATHNVMAVQRAIHCVLGSATRNISRALIAAPNSTMPPASMRLAISRAVGRWSRSSLGTHAIVSNRAMTAAGILTRNVERQPKASTSTPPMGRPTATVTVPAIDSPPSTRPGGSLSPAHMARRRMITIAAGYPAEVPIPISTRATAATGMSCATPPMIPPRSTRRMPANSTSDEDRTPRRACRRWAGLSSWPDIAPIPGSPCARPTRSARARWAPVRSRSVSC